METMESSKNHTASSNLWNISEFNYLPPEVWTQILLSLPAKTLLKFRCVCKSWCSIIDNPDFIHMHFQLCKINSGNNQLLVSLERLQGLLDERWLLTVREAETLRSTDLIFRKSDSYRYRISSSCNGLLLVEVGQYGPHGYQEDLKLWNPCIRKSLLLPTCPLSLSFFTTMYLLGFSPYSKDYKVVAFAFEISDDILPGKLYSAVYTLRDQLWTIGNPITTSMRNPYSLLTAVFFRGATYWLAENDYQRNEPTHLGSFDFDKENIDFLELPFTLDATRFYRFLFLLGGSLAVFSISKVTSSIWVLEQGNEKGPWTLWFSGKSTPDAYHLFFSGLCSYQKVFYYESDGGYFVCGNMAYNIASCQVNKLKRSPRHYFRQETYSESLVLSKGYGGHDLRDFP